MFSELTASRSFLFVLLEGACLGVALVNLKNAGLGIDLHSLWDQGFGTFNAYAYVLPQVVEKLSQVGGLTFSTFVANTPQLLVSGLYLLYNGLITTMLAADERNGYISERKTLRLSCPRGIQRSSYFLSLPLRYGVPLSLASGLLHWLFSQSLFIVASISFVTPDFHYVPTDDAAIIGFSAVGLMLSLIVGVLLTLAPLPLRFLRSYEGPKKSETPGQTAYTAENSTSENDTERGSTADPAAYPMPLVSTCSAAISAACHRHEEDVDTHLLPLIWGFVRDDPSKPRRGRFCFTTARDVEWPENVEENVRD